MFLMSSLICKSGSGESLSKPVKIATHFIIIISLCYISAHLSNYEEWREGSGPMTARQPYPKGAKAGNHKANDGKRNNKTALWAVFQF